VAQPTQALLDARADVQATRIVIAEIEDDRPFLALDQTIRDRIGSRVQVASEAKPRLTISGTSYSLVTSITTPASASFSSQIST
jgi:hypothetical protein